MYNENQIVQVKWNSNNKEWFESRGYIYLLKDMIRSMFL